MTPEEWLAGYLEQGGSPDRDEGSAPGEPGATADEGRGLAGVPVAGAVHLRNRLAEPDIWAQPPDGLFEGIAAGIERERTEAERQGTAGTGETTGHVQRHGPRRRRLGWGIAAAAATAIAATVVVGVVITAPRGTTAIALAGTRLAPEARAAATLRPTPSGLSIALDVSGLPPSAPGYYYQGWMKGTRGLVTIGTFHQRGGPDTVDLWSAVSLADYPTITITREPEDGNPAPSGQVVLTNRP